MEANWGPVTHLQRKQLWSQAEDDLLVKLVNEHGPSKWRNISLQLRTRSARQCRERWTNHLAPNVQKRQFSPEEDDKLINLVNEKGTCWSALSKLFPGRTDSSLKNRYFMFVRHGRVPKPRTWAMDVTMVTTQGNPSPTTNQSPTTLAALGQDMDSSSLSSSSSTTIIAPPPPPHHQQQQTTTKRARTAEMPSQDPSPKRARIANDNPNNSVEDDPRPLAAILASLSQPQPLYQPAPPPTMLQHVVARRSNPEVPQCEANRHLFTHVVAAPPQQQTQAQHLPGLREMLGDSFTKWL